MPLAQTVSDPRPARSDAPDAGLSVTELSELQARELCAREGIPVFWPRRKATNDSE